MTTTPTTRASLLLKLRDPRDHEAWVEFVVLYEPVIYRMLKKFGLQDADALEVMQELLLAVSRSVDRWTPGQEYGSFRVWLRRVTRNLVVNWVRRRKRQLVTTSLDLDSLLIEGVSIEGDESRQFDSEVHRSLFHRASDQVRIEVQPQTWQAFWEVAVSGREVSEVAARLGLTAGAVRVAKCRVIARLREAVDKLKEST
ncbi:MAG: sigma-70 family RNA polymerase sigma factor [Pirellula sp.]